MFKKNRKKREKIDTSETYVQELKTYLISFSLNIIQYNPSHPLQSYNEHDFFVNNFIFSFYSNQMLLNQLVNRQRLFQ